MLSPAIALLMIAISSYQAPDQRLSEVGIVLQRFGIDHHDIDDLAGNRGAVEDLGGTRFAGNLRQ